MHQFFVGIALGLCLAAPQAFSQEHPPVIEAVSEAIAPLMEAGHFPGVAVAVLRQGTPIHVGTYGYASLTHNVPVSTETVFELASLTKPMTALAVTTLAGQGTLRIKDRLSDHVSGLPDQWQTITINQLLSHMGGLAHRFEEKPKGEFLLSYSTDDMLASAINTPMVSEPGTDWNYSDQGYFLLGLVIEAASGMSYAEYMQQRFFRPLGMTQTRFLDQSAIIPGLAEGYTYKDGELQRNRRVWQFELTPHFGAHSSLSDLMLWEAALSNNHRISQAAQHATWKIQRHFSTGESCRQWGYARGWWSREVDGRIIVDHAGYAGTAYIRDVGAGLSVIVLTNREESEGQLGPMKLAWAALNAVDSETPSVGYRCWE